MCVLPNRIYLLLQKYICDIKISHLFGQKSICCGALFPFKEALFSSSSTFNSSLLKILIFCLFSVSRVFTYLSSPSKDQPILTSREIYFLSLILIQRYMFHLQFPLSLTNFALICVSGHVFPKLCTQ